MRVGIASIHHRKPSEFRVSLAHAIRANYRVCWGPLQTRKDQDVAANGTREVLKDLLSDLVRKSWNATGSIEGGRRLNRQRKLRALWADKRFADFDHNTGPTVDFS